MRIGDVQMRMQLTQLIIGVGGRSAQQRGYEFCLVIDHFRHVDIVKKRADIVAVQQFIVKCQNDPADLGKAAIFFKQCLFSHDR